LGIDSGSSSAANNISHNTIVGENNFTAVSEYASIKSNSINITSVKNNLMIGVRRKDTAPGQVKYEYHLLSYDAYLPNISNYNAYYSRLKNDSSTCVVSLGSKGIVCENNHNTNLNVGYEYNSKFMDQNPIKSDDSLCEKTLLISLPIEELNSRIIYCSTPLPTSGIRNASDDGYDIGALNYHNFLPEISSVQINPLNPDETNYLMCNATGIDIENTSLSIEWFWHKNSILELSGNTTVLNNTNTLITTLGSGNTSSGETWNCTVRAYDGVDYSASASSSVTISCTESWSCSAWSSCSGGHRSRTCIDINSCGTLVNKPATSESCTSETGGRGGGGGGGGAGGYNFSKKNITQNITKQNFTNISEVTVKNDTVDEFNITREDKVTQTVNHSLGSRPENLKKPKSVVILPLIIAAILVVGPAAIIGFKLLTYKRKIIKLESYLKLCRQHGLSEGKIRDSLLKSGWPEKVIDSYLKKIN
jgi:hypothetical protein